jgi:hypothetical protein
MSTSKCPFAFVLGIPGQGFHEARIYGYALNDTVGTIVLALITAYLFNIPIWKSLILWFVGGEILHYIFGVQTAALTTLGIEACPLDVYRLVPNLSTPHR